MSDAASASRSTRASTLIRAPPRAVYEAFLDADAVAAWLPPGTMRGRVHAFEPHEGGALHMTLEYAEADEERPRGKTEDDSDRFRGTFVRLVSDSQVVWETEFDSDDAAFRGTMRISWLLEEENGGTRVTVQCDGVPAGIRLEDNEEGSRHSLRQLAAFVERRQAAEPSP